MLRLLMCFDTIETFLIYWNPLVFKNNNTIIKKMITQLNIIISKNVLVKFI